MVHSHVQIQQDSSPHESGCQPRDVHVPAIPQKKGVLDKRDFSLNRGPDYPTSLRIGTVPRLRKVQYSRLGVSKVPDYPPFDRDRDSIGDAESSHHSTEQLEQRTRLPHFHANRYCVDIAKGSNQEGRPPIQYAEVPTAAQTSNIVWQREQAYDQPSSHVRHTLPLFAILRTHVDSQCQKTYATQPRKNQPPPSAPRRVMHARGPLWPVNAGGRVDVSSSTAFACTNTARQFTS